MFGKPIRAWMILCMFCIYISMIAGCGKPIEGGAQGTLPPAVENKPQTQEEEGSPAGEASSEELEEKNHRETRALLEKGLAIRNLSYTARFNSEGNEFNYEFYKRDNLSKMVIWEGDTQSISVSDGKSTVYYSLPDKVGYTMFESGDDMGIVPSVDALLNEMVYWFRTMGEETIFGYLCQVVETEDEFGVLKIWISKTIGLPIKYIGTDDNGWYSLELTDIQLGEPAKNIFTIPSDVVMMRME